MATLLSRSHHQLLIVRALLFIPVAIHPSQRFQAARTLNNNLEKLYKNN